MSEREPYQFDEKLDGKPDCSIEVPSIVKQAEMHIDTYTSRILRQDACCGCGNCQSGAFALIDWVLYPAIMEKAVFISIFDKLKEASRKEREQKEYDGK